MYESLTEMPEPKHKTGPSLQPGLGSSNVQALALSSQAQAWTFGPSPALQNTAYAWTTVEICLPHLEDASK